MIYVTLEIEAQHDAAGAAHAELFLCQRPASPSFIIEMSNVTDADDRVEYLVRPGTRRFTVKAAQPAPKTVWQPRTERGRRLMALRERIVANGTRLLDLDEINQELAGGRRQNV